MAEAMSKADSMKTMDDISDDFELVSDASLIDLASVRSMVSGEYGSRREESVDESPSENNKTIPPESNIHVIDPLEAFEMIQSEHRLLKDELGIQNQLLRHRLSDLEDRDSRKEEEVATLKTDLATMSFDLNEKKMHVASLKSDLAILSLQLDENKTQQTELERQVEYFKECSEKADLLTAKLMEAEDVVKTQNEMIRRMQDDGQYAPVAQSSPPPPTVLSTDETLSTQLKDKDERIKRMEGTLASLESALGSMNGERLKAQGEARELSHMNADLRELISALQSQAEVDKIEWDAVRAEKDQQIQILSDRVTAFENHFSGAPSFVAPDAGVQTLQHRDTQRRPTPAPSQDWIQCQRCHLPMANDGPHPCPSIIDGLD